jgi:hypothetical protein
MLHTTCPRHPQCTPWLHPDGDRCGICGFFFDGREPVPATEQRDIRSFAVYRESAALTFDASFAPIDYYAGSMCGKTGELYEAAKKLVHHGLPMDRALRSHAVETLGDLMWFMDRFAALMDNITLEEVAAFNEQKRRKRYPEAFGQTEDRVVIADLNLIKNPHTEHCCKKCGCKYGEKDCPVVDGRQQQSFPCSGDCRF